MVTEDSYPIYYNDLDLIYETIWTLLITGKKDRNSDFHQCYIASHSNPYPSIRTVVLRHVDKDFNTIGFHTDIRSNKINEISNNSNVSVLLYDHDQKIQVKLYGNAELNHKNDKTKLIWSKIRPFSKKCYLVQNSPGASSELPTSGYSADIEKIQPDDKTLEKGYENFALIEIKIKKLEWLYLHKDGHRRAVLTINHDDFIKEWISP